MFNVLHIATKVQTAPCYTLFFTNVDGVLVDALMLYGYSKGTSV